jgi:hypothetical protein
MAASRHLHADDASAVQRAVVGAPRVIVLVYSPHCGHCSAMRGAWDNAVRSYVACPRSVGTRVVEIDARTLAQAQQQQQQQQQEDGDRAISAIAGPGYNGVPHIVRLMRGSPAPTLYDGDRSESSFLRFFREGPTPPPTNKAKPTRKSTHPVARSAPTKAKPKPKATQRPQQKPKPKAKAKAKAKLAR